MKNYYRAFGAYLILSAFVFSTGLVTGEVKTFKMEEFSVFGKESDNLHMLRAGNLSEQCFYEPAENVKAYPDFTSEKPIYGKILFYSETLFPRIEYCFALDESEGTGKGYDRLYFDGSHDFDLTNDSFIKKAKNPPTKKVNPDEETYFEPFSFETDGKSVTFIPVFRTLSPTYQRMSFIYPTARHGTVKVGSNEHRATLIKMVLPGGYDHPFSYFIFDENMSGLDVLGLLRNVDGVLYQCSASPDGETVSIEPYSGDFGTLAIADPKKQYKKTAISMGWLLAKDKVVDLNQCSKKEDVAQIPVGDYMAVRLAFEVDNVRLGFGADFSEENTSGPDFAIKIQKGQTFEYDIDTQFNVRFDSPKATERIVCGDEVKVSAAMIDTKMNSLLQGIEDMTKPKGKPINLPDGTKLQQYETIDPVVTVTDSAGKQVAEGKMPFG